MAETSFKRLMLKYSYNSRENLLIEEFYIPCLGEAVKYDRAVGYFTGEALKALSAGLYDFTQKKGTIRIVCSPRLSEEDITAIDQGYRKREQIIEEAILREIEQIPNNVIDNQLNLLTWLVAASRLEIKIALPSEISIEGYGIYHEKLGIFYDESGDFIAFSGSNNETLGGLLYNYESFDVFRSWIDSERCFEKKAHFDEIWRGVAVGLKTYDFPAAAREKLIEKIVPQQEPNIDPQKIIGRLRRIATIDKFINSLWYFQKEAIARFKESKWKGIFSMATGSGKTRTAIGAIATMQREINSKFFSVIAAPQNTILKQWKKDCDAISIITNSVFADSSNAKWKEELANIIIDFNDEVDEYFGVFTTYNTLSSKEFIKLIEGIKGNSLLVSDEVHWAGADTFQLARVYRVSLEKSRYFQ